MSIYDNLLLAAANARLHQKRLEMAQEGLLTLSVEDAGANLYAACDKLIEEARAFSWTPKPKG